MPIYEYRCGACGFQQESLQKMSDPPLTDCPECGKPSLSKMVTAAGFQLKGSGWYATDFKHGSKPKPDAATAGKSEDKNSAVKADDKPAAKTDDKPAAKTDAKVAPAAPAAKPAATASTATPGTGTGPASS